MPENVEHRDFARPGFGREGVDILRKLVDLPLLIGDVFAFRFDEVVERDQASRLTPGLGLGERAVPLRRREPPFQTHDVHGVLAAQRIPLSARLRLGERRLKSRASIR